MLWKLSDGGTDVGAVSITSSFGKPKMPHMCVANLRSKLLTLSLRLEDMFLKSAHSHNIVMSGLQDWRDHVETFLSSVTKSPGLEDEWHSQRISSILQVPAVCNQCRSRVPSLGISQYLLLTRPISQVCTATVLSALKSETPHCMLRPILEEMFRCKEDGRLMET
jgi:hypothetical protein